jgi:aspartate dehydrogenase
MAERLIDIAAVAEPTVFHRGAARRAALGFPQNANVVAAVALAGIGFDLTEVELIADPTSPGNRHVVHARRAFGQLTADVLARTLPENPKTSMLTPCSILRTMENLGRSVVI